MSILVQRSRVQLKKNLKASGYLLFLVPLLIPYLGYWLAQHYHAPNVLAWSGVILVYLAIPVLDLFLGKDSVNPPEEDVARLSNLAYFRWLPIACVPLAGASLLGGAWMLSTWHELSFIGQIGLLLSIGSVHSALMINVGHELIHKKTGLEQWAGGIMLCMVSYPSFKIEHIRGHHVNVATPLDRSTSRYNQSLYDFLLRAIFSNVSAAWKLEKQLLIKRELNPWSLSNELIRWYLLTVLIAAVLTAIFGVLGLLYFVAQSLIAILLLETVNYLEHYGLERKILANGRYERTTHQHSWNSNYWLSNMLTFQLQRHSDHHAQPQRRYNVLRHFDDSPQLPAGYSVMVLLAMVPPLWRRVMNPRIDAYYRN